MCTSDDFCIVADTETYPYMKTVRDGGEKSKCLYCVWYTVFSTTGVHSSNAATIN